MKVVWTTYTFVIAVAVNVFVCVVNVVSMWRAVSADRLSPVTTIPLVVTACLLLMVVWGHTLARQAYARAEVDLTKAEHDRDIAAAVLARVQEASEEVGIVGAKAPEGGHVNLWLVQYLCPLRHAIVASPYDRDEKDPATVEAEVLAAMQPMVNPWCGLCGSRTLHFEHGKLKASSWEEAMAMLTEGQRDQMETRRFFAAMRSNN